MLLFAATGLVLPTARAAAPSITAGYGRTCAINAAGTPFCWGDDTSGALGDGADILSRTPLQVNGLASGMASVATSAGAFHTCATSTSGVAYCWGNGKSGQLGNGSYASSTVPVAVRSLSGVAALAVGNVHTCALTTSGAVYCWGYNGSGRIGTGATAGNYTLPAPVATLAAGVRAITAGTSHTCALTVGGAVLCWGANDMGQLGTGTQIAASVPTAVVGLASGVLAISAGFNHTCALTDSGRVLCWGANDSGQIGNGTTDNASVPVLVANLPATVGISAGGYHACAVTGSGAAFCWGNNYSGQIGNGTYTNALSPVPVSGLASGVAAITGGYLHTCALMTNGSSMCWGWNGFGQFADGTKTSSPTPVASSALDVPIVSIVAGDLHTCALTTAGAVLCWGANTDFQLGDNESLGRSSPGVPSGLGSGFVAIATGDAHTCAVNATGGVICWGSDLQGQIGNAGFSSLPEPGGPTSGISAIATGGDHTCALTTAGAALCWGLNDLGQLGDGTTTRRFDPVPVTGLSAGIIAIDAGHRHSCALDSGGGVRCWGYNAYGQLGNGTTTDSTVPVAVSNLSGATAISVGGWHDCAITAPGGVVCWGYNASGELGNGATADSSIPVAVAGLSSGIVAVSAGDEHTCAVTAAGAALCWGSNAAGQLGDGTLQSSAIPVAVMGLSSGVAAIAAGHAHTCALLVQGDVMCWGDNGTGGLGDATFAGRSKSVVVVRENAAGSLATNDWYLDLDPAIVKAIPPDKVPAYLVDTSGNATTALVQVTANVQFRAQDAGRPIYVYGYVPAALVKRDGSKDGSCVLSQIDASGLPQQASASGLQAYASNALGAQQQSVNVLNNALAANVGGSTFCVGTAATSAQSVDPANSRCVATVPPVNSGDPLCLPPDAGANVPGPLSGLWFDAAEQGWGIDFTQRRNIVFAAWYTYDGAGNPKWYVASDCAMPAGNTGSSGTCNGSLYEFTGPALASPTFDPTAVSLKAAGNLQVTFTDASHASMTYSAAGQARTVAITRQVFSTGTTPPVVDYTDLWWNPAELGWGIAVTQQYDVMFLAWFVYDGSGNPVWYVASDCTVSGNGCSGVLYRTTGPAFGATFDPSRVHTFETGTVSVSFSDPNNGKLSYTVNGITATKSITRQLF